jgi:hypothetical protein
MKFSVKLHKIASMLKEKPLYRAMFPLVHSQSQPPFTLLQSVFLAWLTFVLEINATGFPDMLQTI